MTHSNSVHAGGCCCHRILVQFDEIKNELQNIRRTVGVALTLLSVSRMCFSYGSLHGLCPSFVCVCVLFSYSISISVSAVGK
jgi:hypothetical protein